MDPNNNDNNVNPPQNNAVNPPSVEPPMMNQPLAPTPITPSQVPPSPPIDSTPMYVEEVPHHRHISRMVIITVLVLFIAIISFVFFQRFSSENKSKIDPKNQPNSQIPVSTAPMGANPVENISAAPISPTTVAVEVKGTKDMSQPWFSVVTEENKTTYTMAEEIHFIIKGYSQGQDINGYDVLVSYDKDALEIISVESIPQTFETKQIEKDTHFTITGFKRLDVTTPTVFNDDGIVKITAKPKKAGKAQFTISPQIKKERTKMVDKQVQVITPQVEGIEVAIQ